MMASADPPTDTLTLVCPDWRELERSHQLPDPFVLWPVGDQPLLYHWFDYALDHGWKHVRILVADRPHRVREMVKEATLWPISFEVVTVSAVKADEGEWLGGLPGRSAPELPGDPWDLLDQWREMDHAWLDANADNELAERLSIGRACRIHPSAKLVAPYFIGDHVAIGPDCVVGPYAAIGSGSLVAEGTIVRRARLMPHGFLGAHLTLEQAILFGRVLFNCKHRARVERLDSFLADSTEIKDAKVPWSERLLAFSYWVKFRLKLCGGLPANGEEVPLGGQHYPGLAIAPRWAERIPRLWAAACGRMRLFGPLPRSDEQLSQLPEDWQAILRNAQPGAIAYSDCLGCHSPEDPAEALHAVYQATHPEQTTAQCRKFLQLLTRK